MTGQVSTKRRLAEAPGYIANRCQDPAEDTLIGFHRIRHKASPISIKPHSMYGLRVSGVFSIAPTPKEMADIPVTPERDFDGYLLYTREGIFRCGM